MSNYSAELRRLRRIHHSRASQPGTQQQTLKRARSQPRKYHIVANPAPTSATPKTIRPGVHSSALGLGLSAWPHSQWSSQSPTVVRQFGQVLNPSGTPPMVPAYQCDCASLALGLRWLVTDIQAAVDAFGCEGPVAKAPSAKGRHSSSHEPFSASWAAEVCESERCNDDWRRPRGNGQCRYRCDRGRRRPKQIGEGEKAAGEREQRVEIPASPPAEFIPRRPVVGSHRQSIPLAGVA